MTRTDEISFQMIADVGAANAQYIEAIEAAKKGNMEEASKLVKDGEECYRKSHQVHAELIRKMADGEEINVNLFLIHAEDQLMNAEVIKILAEQTIELHKRIISLEEQVKGA